MKREKRYVPDKRITTKDNNMHYQLLVEAKQSVMSRLERSSICVESEADPNMAAELAAQREIAAQRLQSDFITLGEIDHALAKVGTDAFGLCESCDVQITRGRLEAIPWARLCKGCQEQAELELEQSRLERVEEG